MKNMLFGFAALIAIGFAYLNMPFEWRRHKDIAHGNTLIQNIKTYQATQKRLPENQDEAMLQQLGFVKNKQGWQPAYQKINAQHFRLIYQDGYAPPYLYWQSDEQKWAVKP
ncbi:hypothetical protein ACKLNO_09095 [Neisseriaceae bacterium B1]